MQDLADWLGMQVEISKEKTKAKKVKKVKETKQQQSGKEAALGLETYR